MSTPDPAWRVKRTPCPFYQSGRCIFKQKCNFIHDGDITMRRSDVRAQVPVYRRTPENSVDSFSSSEEDEPVQQHQIDEHSAAAPSLVFSSIYGPRPNSINRLQLANVDLPVSPESLPHTPPRTSRPTSHHSAHNHISITSPAPSRPLSSSLGIGIGGRAQGGLAEVFAAIANTQAQAQSTALPPSSAGSLPSPLSLSPKSPARSPNSPTNGVQEIIIKDEGYSLEQLPFKLALSNQSSLLLNRTSRAAQRRSSSFPQRQDTSSSSGVDREKYPTDFSAPERLSIGSLPKHPGDRPISVLSAERVAEEEQADDEQDEEEQEIVDESPSFEALQPYPRDVSTEPSPDPTRQAFIPPAPVPPPLPAQQPPKPHGRNNSTRHIDHELVIDELEERLGVEPTRRRRARSNAAPNTGPSATSPNRSTSQPMGKQADATWERKPPIQMPKSNVDMGAARDMLSAMFAKRDQRAEERIEEPSSDEQSFLPVDWDIGSMVGLDEEDQSGNQEVPAQIEPTVVQREPTSTRRKSIIPQSRASIPIPQPNPPIPLSQPAPQPDAQPQTPSTVSTVPETPNTQITHSTQPTPPSDHGFDETDTEDEHPEDLADLIEAEPVVLRTPQSVVLRREVGRETSLPSRTGTGTGAGTPGVWTPRNGSGAWTPRHGSVVGGSGGLQIVESPTVERRQPERRQSAEQSRPTLSQRRQPTNGQQIGDTTQSTISEVSLNTVSGQTENMSPVSRPLVSDHASVPVPIVAPAVSSAPILGSVPPLGNGLGLGLGLELELELDSVPPSGLGSSNDFDSGVLARDIVSPLPSVSTPSSPSPPSDGVLGLGAGLHSGDVSPAPSGTSPALVGSGPILPVAAERMPQAAPATLVSLSPVASPAEPPVASASVLPAESSMSISQAIVPAIERSITPESAPSFVPDPVPRAEPGLPVSTAESVVLQETSGSVLSVESGPSSSTPESNLVGRANPSLVAGPDSEDDLSISHSLDRDIASIIAHSSESSGVPVEPIRDAPHTDRVNLDSERVVPGSSRVTVQHHVPEQGGPFEGKRRGSKLAEDVHGNMVQDGDQKDVIRGDSMVVLKEMDEIVAEGEDRVEAAGVGLINEEGAASIEESHEDLQRAVHQGRTEERPRVTNIGVQDAAGGNKEDDRRVYRDVRQESPGSVNADIGKVDTEPVVRGGDVGARVLVSDSELEPQRVTIPISTSPPPSKPVSVLPDDETAPRVPQIPVSKRSTERVAENAPTADKFVVAPARVPSAKQASSSEANQDEAREQVGILEDATSVAVEPSEPIKAPGSVEQRTATGQAVLELDSVDANLPLDTQELATGALSKDDSSVAERLASEDGLKEPVASETSTTRSPLVVSKPPSLLAAPELAPITSLSDSISFTRVPVGDEAVLEPDHVDSLSELEESFGASSPAIDERLPKSASAQPVTPLLTPDILAPADALVQSTLPVLEESPMLRPISPLAPLSPTLHSSASISPSPPEPLSPISSPPTTSSLPGSPSLAVSFAPPASPSAPEPRLSRPQSILSSTNALPEDGSTIKHEVPVLPEAASRPTSLEPEQPMSPEPFSKLGSLQAESLTMQKASTSFHPVLSDPPLPAEHHPPPEISLSPRSPTIELQPSREPSSLEQVKDDAPGPGIIPVSKSSLVLEPVSPDETPSATRPRSSKSVSYESSPLYESAVLSQPSPPYDPSPSSEPLKTSEISPSPVTPKGNFPSARQHASLPQSPLAPESISTPLTPPLAEPAHPHDYPPLPTSSSSSLPGLGSSFAEASAPIPGPSHPNTPFEPLDNPRPLSEPNSGSVLPIPPEQPPSHAIVPPETPESTALPESSELSESISVPNSSLLPNNCLSDVSLPLEPLSSPRLSPLSPPRLSPLSQPPPSLESAELPGPSPSHNPSTLHEPSPLITHPLFEPSPWPGLSVIPKPSPSLPVSPSSLPHSSFHDPLPLSDPSHSPEPSPSPNPGPLPDVFSVPDPSMPPELPPTEYLQRNEQPVVPESSEAECLGNSQEPPVTPDRLAIRGVPDPLSPWGSLRLRRAPGLQSASDEEQQPPKSSLLFDCASLPPDSPQSSHTPLPRLPTLPEDSPLLDYAPSLEQVRSEEHTENFEGKGLPGCIEPLGAPVGTFAVSSERSGEPRSRSPIEEPQLSQRSSLSEIPSLSDFAPLPIRSDTAPQYVRTTSLASEPRAASEPYSKPRPRSQLKPLRLSLLHGLGTPSPGAIITPVSANTVTPSPSFGSEVATPTPAAMYPTPSSAHPTQMSANLRSSPKTQATVEEITEANVSAGETTGLDPVSWFGAKNGVKRGTLSAARQSVHRSVQESNRSSLLHDATILSEERGSLPATTEQPSPHSPIVSAEYKDEDVRPLPMIWDDETEAGSIAGPSRQGTRSSIQSQSRAVPALETSSPDTGPVDVAPPPKTPDRLDTVPRYPTFVTIGTTSPRISEGKSPLPSPPAVSERASESPGVQRSDVEPAAPRSRKWADTINQESIGSLPDFSVPTPSAQMLDEQPPESNEPHTPSNRKDRRHYMKIPNTAPLSISPRRVSPSIMQRDQEEGMGSYEQGASSQDEMQPYAAPDTAPLDLRLRMAKKESTTGPWMAEYFTNSPSSFHSSQVGGMHSASSSLSTRAKIVGNRYSVSSNKQVNGPLHVEDGTFGNPGPGPSTMKTYSERHQFAEVLGSPIALESQPPEPASSVPKTPRPYALTGPAKRMSSQISSASMDLTPTKAEDALQLKVSPAEPIMETEMSTLFSNTSSISQPPAQDHSIEASPTEQRTTYKALSLSSPSPGRQPPTPLTAASPLQILRRNLMARTSPESPRFLSPQTRFTNLPEPRLPRHHHHASVSLAPTTYMRDELRNVPMSAPGPRDRRSLTPNTRFAATPSIPGSPAQSVHSTISQSKPLLFFAIAKNSAQEVERLLQDGEVKPNDKAGPEDLPALAFALANEQLSDKTQIVKSLLSHGADPSSVLHRKTGSGQFDDADLALTTRIEQGMNPAIRYYLNRKQMTIPAPQAELLEKHNFGGLTRAGFSIIGQDAALEELIRVVAGHCRRQALNPLVVVFSGGPGCGKSLLASKIGPLLHVPYFTVNMTNLRNEATLFNYISMTTKVGQPQIPLMDFLRNNQGRRCVVVLEEIEKAADKTVWHSLLMPWEWGKATVISPTNNEQIDIDTSQVIWIATSNSGDDATLKFFAERSRPTERGESALVRLAHNPRPKEDNFTRKDYLQLMQAVRKRLGELLGSSMISRVSSVLPFLPFTEDEVYALASESLSAMRAEQKGDQSYEDVDWEELLQQAVGEYIPGEGARSVHRAVQRAFDEIAEW